MKRLYSTYEAAQAVGVRADTLKKKERRGELRRLIGAVERDQRGWRVFSEEQVEKLRAYYDGALGLRALSLGAGVQSTTLLRPPESGVPSSAAAMGADGHECPGERGVLMR